MIRLSNANKWFFKGSERQVHAIRELNLELSQNSYTVIVGSNGSGKSTLLNLIAGSLDLDSGSLSIDKVDQSHYRQHQRSHFVSRVFQDPLMGTASDLTVLENFRLASLRSRKKGITIGMDKDFKKKVQQCVSEIGLGLENKLDQPIGTLSGGQRKALTLLMTIMDETKVLLMDEPASALDPATASVIMELANRITMQHRLTTILVTHNIKDALKYGDRIIMMSNGKISHDVSGNEKNALKPADVLNWF